MISLLFFFSFSSERKSSPEDAALHHNFLHHLQPPWYSILCLFATNQCSSKSNASYALGSECLRAVDQSLSFNECGHLLRLSSVLSSRTKVSFRLLENVSKSIEEPVHWIDKRDLQSSQQGRKQRKLINLHGVTALKQHWKFMSGMMLEFEMKILEMLVWCKQWSQY